MIQVIIVKEPIEVGRRDYLFAIVQIGGLSHFLYPFEQDIDQSISELKQWRHLGSVDIRFIPLPKDLTFTSESSQDIDDSTESDLTDDNQSDEFVKTHKQSKDVKSKKSKTSEKSEAFSSTPTPNALSYKPSDPSKSYEVLLLPDYDKLYELFIESKGLVNSDVNFTLTGGWQLTSVGVKSDPTAMLTAISSLAGSAIGAQKEVKIAGIGLKQALELEKLKQGGAADAAGEAQALIAPDGIVDVSFTVLGYVKKIEVLTIITWII